MVVADDGARGHVLNTIGLDGRPLTLLSAMRIAGIEERVLSPALLAGGGVGQDVKTTPEAGSSEW